MALTMPRVVRADSSLLASGISAYESFEYDTALDLLQRALRETESPSERATTYLYIGLTQFNKGDRDHADASFRHALDEDPRIALPAQTSPKVAERFNAVRAAHVVNDSPRQRTWTWVAAGAAVALAGTGVIFGARANSAANKVDDAVYADDAQHFKDSATSRQHTANILYVGAGLAAATAVTLFFLENRPRPEPTVSVGLTWQSVNVLARW